MNLIIFMSLLTDCPFKMEIYSKVEI